VHSNIKMSGFLSCETDASISQPVSHSVPRSFSPSILQSVSHSVIQSASHSVVHCGIVRCWKLTITHRKRRRR